MYFSLFSRMFTVSRILSAKFEPVKSVILFKLTVHFIVLPVANFKGNTSWRVRKEVSNCD